MQYWKYLNGFLIFYLFFKTDDVSSVSLDELESFFHALRRLVASKAGFEAFTTLPKYVYFFTSTFTVVTAIDFSRT